MYTDRDKILTTVIISVGIILATIVATGLPPITEYKVTCNNLETKWVMYADISDSGILVYKPDINTNLYYTLDDTEFCRIETRAKQK